MSKLLREAAVQGNIADVIELDTAEAAEAPPAAAPAP